ncbi:unnamed protein product [Amoebophrya sp. A120]|nr:unnamed protein product [Amoebophrya sp. A120]|eukprot:GSA120T00004312001.1
MVVQTTPTRAVAVASDRSTSSSSPHNKDSATFAGAATSAVSASATSSSSSSTSSRGKDMLSLSAKNTSKRKVLQTDFTLADFEIGTTLGIGAFGRVYFAKSKKHGNRIVALKSLQKQKLVKQNQTKQAYCERDLLSQLTHPFLVELYGVFQTNRNVYFVLEFVRGGEFFFHLRQRGRLIAPVARFYAGCIVAAFQYLHVDKRIVYRDLKPENLLLAHDGYLKLADFGAAKLLDACLAPSNGGAPGGDFGTMNQLHGRTSQELDGTAQNKRILNNSNQNRGPSSGKKSSPTSASSTRPSSTASEPVVLSSFRTSRTKSFVGTPEYIAPEILLNQGHDCAVDWWCLGVFLFEMLTGNAPFREESSSSSDENREDIPPGVDGRDEDGSKSASSPPLSKQDNKPRQKKHQEAAAKIPYPLNIYQKLLGRERVRFPSFLKSEKSARDIIQHLLCADPGKRWTHKQLVPHKFFTTMVLEEELVSSTTSTSTKNSPEDNKSVCVGDHKPMTSTSVETNKTSVIISGERYFQQLLAKKLEPPFLPTLKSEEDTSNFEYYSDSEEDEICAHANGKSNNFAKVMSTVTYDACQEAFRAWC